MTFLAPSFLGCDESRKSSVEGGVQLIHTSLGRHWGNDTIGAR